jgi:predicted small secreted protein
VPPPLACGKGLKGTGKGPWDRKHMGIIVKKGITIITFLFLCALLASGCATTRKITDDVLGKGRALKKKIGFLPAAKNAGFGGEDLEKTASAQLKDYLERRCDGLTIMNSRKIREALAGIPRLGSGPIHNPAIANLGRDHGLGVVLEQKVAGVEYITDKRGIWGFRHISKLARVSFLVRAYDVETTALVFDEIVEEEVELSEGVWNQAKKTGSYNTDLAQPILSKIIPETGKLICERLAEEPWKGYVVGSSDRGLTISGGKDVGLAAGDILEVFGKGKEIEGQGARVYFLPGPKIGEVKVTNVDKDRAEAINLSGHNLENSWSVKLKP